MNCRGREDTRVNISTSAPTKGNVFGRAGGKLNSDTRHIWLGLLWVSIEEEITVWLV